MAIPQVLHLTSREIPLRGFEQGLARRNRSRLPGWTVRLWSDEENDRVFGEHFPQHLEAYRALPFGVMRADVARLLYMHVDGGWYADTDYEWFRTPVVDEHYRAVLPMENERVVGNCVFASEAGHPIWADLIDGIFATDRRSAARDEILASTGPDYLTARLPMLRAHDDVWFAERKYFHSPVVHASPEAIGVHHTVGSWRTRRWKWRLEMLQRRVVRRLRRRPNS